VKFAVTVAFPEESVTVVDRLVALVIVAVSVVTVQFTKAYPFDATATIEDAVP
jgi:hypothetical protein